MLADELDSSQKWEELGHDFGLDTLQFELIYDFREQIRYEHDFAAGKGLMILLATQTQESDLLNALWSAHSGEHKWNVPSTCLKLLQIATFALAPRVGIHRGFDVNEMHLCWMKSDYVELALPAAAGEFAYEHISANEVALVFVPFGGELFKVVHL